MLCNTKLLQTCWGPIRGQDSWMWTNQTPRRGLVPVSCPHLVTRLVTQRRVRQNVLGRSSRLLGCLVKVGLFRRRWLRVVQWETRLWPGRPMAMRSGKDGEVCSFPTNCLTHGLCECEDTRGAISEKCGGGWAVRRVWPSRVWKSHCAIGIGKNNIPPIAVCWIDADTFN